MNTITSTNQVKLNSGACLNQDVSDVELGIRALVGYHNYFRVGVHDAVKMVESACKKAGLNWVAGYGEVPENGVRVGQVTVHHGDRDYPLYVVKRINN